MINYLTLRNETRLIVIVLKAINKGVVRPETNFLFTIYYLRRESVIYLSIFERERNIYHINFGLFSKC